MSAPFKTFCMPGLDASNHGYNKIMIRTADTVQTSVSQCQLCESLFYCSHGWKHPSRACNMSWMELHGTDVVNFSHYWSSIHYLRHRIDDLWVAFACLWQKLYHFTIVISSWRFCMALKMQVFTFSVWGDTVSSYRDLHACLGNLNGIWWGDPSQH